MIDCKEHDVVRVRAMPINVHDIGGCTPGLGDRGAVVQILHADNNDSRYVVESIDPRGITLWLAEFASDALEKVASHPTELLTFSTMASGHRALLIRRNVSWGAFPDCADKVVARLNAVVVDVAEDPSVRLRTLLIKSQRYWLSWDEQGGTVALEPCNLNAADAMNDLRRRLAASRPIADALFTYSKEQGKPARLRSECPELDFFMNDELRDGGSVDDSVDESLTLELAQQIQDVRAGRTRIVRNGSDAMFVSFSAYGVLLEYAIPNSPRPGPIITLHSFVDVFVRWFELVNPLLGIRIRSIVWPRSFIDTEKVTL